MGACGVLLEFDWIDLGGDDGDVGEPCDEGKPPDVNSEELAALDEAAGYEELSRFLEMKVILRSKRAKRRCLFPSQKGLDLTNPEADSISPYRRQLIDSSRSAAVSFSSSSTTAVLLLYHPLHHPLFLNVPHTHPVLLTSQLHRSNGLPVALALIAVHIAIVETFP